MEFKMIIFFTVIGMVLVAELFLFWIAMRALAWDKEAKEEKRRKKKEKKAKALASTMPQT